MAKVIDCKYCGFPMYAKIENQLPGNMSEVVYICTHKLCKGWNREVFAIEEYITLSTLAKDAKKSLNKIRSKTMELYASQKVIESQVGLLQNMKTFLDDTLVNLDELIKQQHQTLKNLEDEGLDLRCLERLVEFSKTNTKRIEKIKDRLIFKEIPYTENLINHLNDKPIRWYFITE